MAALDPIGRYTTYSSTGYCTRTIFTHTGVTYTSTFTLTTRIPSYETTLWAPPREASVDDETTPRAIASSVSWRPKAELCGPQPQNRGLQVLRPRLAVVESLYELRPRAARGGRPVNRRRLDRLRSQRRQRQDRDRKSAGRPEAAARS